MPRAFNPTLNITDQLGTQQEPWEQIFVRAIYDGNGNILRLVPTPNGFLGIDAGDVIQGLLDPERIDRLTPETIVVPPSSWPFGPSLAEIRDDAAIGAQNPITRINGSYGPPGPGLGGFLNGQTIFDGSLKPSALNPLVALVQKFLVGDAGSLETDDYNDGTGMDPAAGYRMSKTEWAVRIATAVFAGIVSGRINIANFFKVNPDGSARFSTDGMSGMGVDTAGNVFFGGEDYFSSQTQIDAAGNTYIADGPNSKNLIQLGACEPFVDSVNASQAGGQFQGVGVSNNLKLTAMTRGSTIWYTLATGVDPADPTNAFGRINYSAVGLAVYDPNAGLDIDTSSGDKIVKIVAEKFGVCSAILKLTFTNTAGAPSLPVFDPQPEIAINPTGTLDVSILSNSSIKFTNWKKNTTDPGPPSDINGTAYSGPIHLTKGTWTIRAFSKNAFGSSVVVTGVFTVKVGTSPTDGTGTDNSGGTGGGSNPPGHSSP